MPFSQETNTLMHLPRLPEWSPPDGPRAAASTFAKSMYRSEGLFLAHRIDGGENYCRTLSDSAIHPKSFVSCRGRLSPLSKFCLITAMRCYGNVREGLPCAPHLEERRGIPSRCSVSGLRNAPFPGCPLRSHGRGSTQPLRKTRKRSFQSE